MNLAKINTTKKTGTEPFTSEGVELTENITSFWQWSSSELLGNALRGILAEFIVALSAGVVDNLREEWDEYDLQTKHGLKIEVKSSAYLQSWQQKELSKISFGIKPTGQSQLFGSERSRKSDVYVFCLLSHKDKSTVDPLNLDQWDFYILKTSILDEKIPFQKTITLSSLLRLKPVKTSYRRLSSELNKIINSQVLEQGVGY